MWGTQKSSPIVTVPLSDAHVLASDPDPKDPGVASALFRSGSSRTPLGVWQAASIGQRSSPGPERLIAVWRARLSRASHVADLVDKACGLRHPLRGTSVS